jgi:glycosyltransferase involved in cell wall biosynthesis
LLDLEDSVFLKGAVPGCELYLKLEKADIYIATSVYEGLSIAAIEAMSLGLPVIFSDIPAHRELVNSQDYVYPFLFPVGDKSDLAKKIIKLTANPDLYDAAAKWCHNQSFMFTGDKMADNYYKLYSE